MQQIRAYKDGRKWVITIEDTEKDIDDIVKAMISQLMTESPSEVPSQVPSVDMTLQEAKTDPHTEPEGIDKPEPPLFVRQLKAEKQAQEKEALPKAEETKLKPESSSQNDPYEKAVLKLRAHKSSKVLSDKLIRQFGTHDVEEIIQKRSKAEIISLFIH